MADKEFNLLDENWVRVITPECEIKEVSLTDAIVHSHEYSGLCGELPTQDVAVMRLLLAVLHTVFSPRKTVLSGAGSKNRHRIRCGKA